MALTAKSLLVARALLRAASSLTRRLYALLGERRQECRRGTQECVRHISPSVRQVT